MPRQKIHETLVILHQQLQGASDLDSADRAHLREVVAEIERTLDEDEDHTGVGDRVKQAVAAFEVSHPTIATALHGIVEALKRI